jgi:hypothetical protein
MSSFASSSFAEVAFSERNWFIGHTSAFLTPTFTIVLPIFYQNKFVKGSVSFNELMITGLLPQSTVLLGSFKINTAIFSNLKAINTITGDYDATIENIFTNGSNTLSTLGKPIKLLKTITGNYDSAETIAIILAEKTNTISTSIKPTKTIAASYNCRTNLITAPITFNKLIEKTSHH